MQREDVQRHRPALIGSGRAADGAERQGHSMDRTGRATAGQSMAGSSRGIAMTRDDIRRKRTDTLSQGTEMQGAKTICRGMAMHCVAAALDGYDQRRQAKDRDGIDSPREDWQGLGMAANGYATASGRRDEKSKGMALRCMGSDARQGLGNGSCSNGMEGQRCAAMSNAMARSSCTMPGMSTAGKSRGTARTRNAMATTCRGKEWPR